jgi:hypothetical protein
MRLVVTETITIDGLVWEPGEYEIEDPYWAMRLYERLRQAAVHASGEQAESQGETGSAQDERPRRRRG